MRKVVTTLAPSAIVFLLSAAPRAHAATFTVDRTDDAAVSTCSAAPNDCTLRDAVTAANAHAGADTINFDATIFAAPGPHVISLATSLRYLTGDVTITGPGASALTVKEGDANQAFTIIIVNSGVSATFRDLTISNGGDGIYNDGTVTAINCNLSGFAHSGIVNFGTASATNCNLSGNSSHGFGNGIYNASNGTLTATNCILSGNSIGISNSGTLTATNCTMNGNSTGIGNIGTASVTYCTLSNNSYDGINNNSTLTATNCTLSGCNIGIGNSGTSTVTHCTLSGNSYGIYNPSGTVTLNNTLVVGNPTNVEGTFTDGGNNITSGTAADAGLDPAGLQDNSGPTKTIALIAGSPAIDAGNSTLTTDQRGFSRPSGSAADIGAFEAGGLPALTVNNPRSLPEGNVGSPGSVTFDVTLNAASTQSVTVNFQTTNGTNNPATAGSDYVEKHGKLTFAPGETLKRVTISFIGDSTVELNETFFFDLKTPTNATIADSRGVGQINNDDGPGITIDNALAINEGSAGTSSQNFTVHLSAASTDTITVNYATADITATDGSDYVANSGLLTFAPGEISKTVTVLVKGDTTVEPNETYKVVLSKVMRAFIADGTGVGTIRNDDAAPQIFEDEPSQ